MTTVDSSVHEGRDTTRLRCGRRLGTVGAVVALAALAGGAAACGTSAGATTTATTCSPGTATMTVDATGQASATPDTLTIAIGITVSDPTAASALSDANSRAATLTAALGSSGVPPSGIQSTDFSIAPDTTPTGVITGYQVSNTLVVTTHDLSTAGRTIDTAASSVGNAIRIDGLSYSVSNTRDVDGQARADAVAAAAAHARAMAVAAGESLGGVGSVSDSTDGVVPIDANSSALGAGSPATAAAAVPLEPGTQQATADVSVVYRIVPR